jgi:hypothetical protein
MLPIQAARIVMVFQIFVFLLVFFLILALVEDGKHGHVERIQSFRGPACHTTFSVRRHTPAMAAGRTTQRWTAREVLSCPLPPVSA